MRKVQEKRTKKKNRITSGAAEGGGEFDCRRSEENANSFKSHNGYWSFHYTLTTKTDATGEPQAISRI